METAQQREERIKRLEYQRAERRAQGGGAVWPTPDDAGVGVMPIEIGPGRGDLNIASGWYPAFPTALQLVGHRAVSFARIFMSQPWVAAAVMRMLTWALRVPLKVYQRTGDDTRLRLGPGDHVMADLVLNPWDGGSQADLVMALLGPLLVHGNSVTQVLDDNLDNLGLLPKDWRFSRPIMPFRDSLDGFVFDYDSPAFRQEVSIDSVLHIKYWSPGGSIGVSPMQQLGVTVQIEDAIQRVQRAYYVNGARPPSAVTASDAFLGMDREERQAILAQIRQDMAVIYSGPENSGRPALLPPGLDWKTIAHTNEEAQLIDQRKITREEIAGVYLIPPPLLGILDKATYSNIQVQREMTYTDCLGPPLVLIEQAINAQILHTLLQQDDIYVEFDFGAVLRGDRLQEIDALRNGIATGLITPNEGRTVLNMPKSGDPAMDRFYMPVNNLQPVGSGPNAAPGAGGQPGDTEPPVTVPDMPEGPGDRGHNGHQPRLHVSTRGGEYVRVFGGAGSTNGR